jgi:gamma-glutamyltranspeptidase/glutathione hydrolase
LINLEHPTPAKDIKPAALVTDESPHTAHTSIMDGDGNAVSITTTVNFYFGAGVVVPGTGIFLNDEMDDFATQPGGTNLSGLPDSAPNAIAPGKRPISSMIPTIVLQGEQPVLVVGAAGSSTIISGVLQTILNDLVVWPHDLKRAVFAARAHKQYDPKNDVLTLEPNGFSKQTEAALIKMGHSVQPAKFSPQVQAVEFNPQTGMITAVHEPRDEGGVSAK